LCCCGSAGGSAGVSVLCEDEAAEAHNKNEREHHSEFASHSDDSPSNACNGNSGSPNLLMKELKRSDELCINLAGQHFINDAPSHGSNGRASSNEKPEPSKFPKFVRVEAQQTSQSLWQFCSRRKDAT
jgi:hypothetical protein